jgi:hypothetical protein
MIKLNKHSLSLKRGVVKHEAKAAKAVATIWRHGRFTPGGRVKKWP